MKLHLLLPPVPGFLLYLAGRPFAGALAGLSIFGAFTRFGGTDDSAAMPRPVSADARRASELLDSGACSEALHVLELSLGKSRTDAEVLGQYARGIILSRHPADPGFMRSPLARNSDSNWASNIAIRAVTMAADLDPSRKRGLADLIFQAFHQRVEKSFREGEACFGISQLLCLPETGENRFYSGPELGMIQVCWKAISIDPATAANWAPRYGILVETAAARGKVISAMMLGNLCGDMRQGGKGDEDFKTANQAFLRALENHQQDAGHDFLQEAADAYPACFSTELAGNPNLIDPSFGRLKAKLRSRGVSIPRPGAEPRNHAGLQTSAVP